MQTIVFTDLDGTLLDFEDYSYQVAEPYVHQLKQRRIPVIFCSSKTRVEQQYYRGALENSDPFIVENGSAVFIPRGYFPFRLNRKITRYPVVEFSRFEVIILGETFKKVREGFEKVREEIGITLQGYADLAIEEIAAITHLNVEFAQRAATRDFSETLLKGDTASENFEQFKQNLATEGLTCVSGGKFHTVMGAESDKGRAVEVLTNLFAKEYGEVNTVGLGDSVNDLPLLKAVDQGYLVQKPDKSWLNTKDKSIQKVAGIGPHGWVKVAQSLVTV